MSVPSLVRSVQRGTVTLAATILTNTATITGVDLNNAAIRYGGSDWDGGATTTFPATYCRLELTNGTTVTVSRNTGTNACVIAYEVIEYWPGVLRRAQRGTIVIAAGAGSAIATVAAVNTAKAELSWLSSEVTDTAGHGYVQVRIVLTNSTTVTASRVQVAGTAALTVGYQVLDWY